MYFDGRGVRRNQIEAVGWFLKSAAQVSERALRFDDTRGPLKKNVLFGPRLCFEGRCIVRPREPLNQTLT